MRFRSFSQTTRLRAAALLAVTILCLGWSSLTERPTALTLAQAPPSTQPNQANQATPPAATPQPLDPAAWGSNHVGQPIPEYVPGDECLFCHRNQIGTIWQQNAHGITVRQREDAPALQAILAGQAALAQVTSEIEFFLGSRQRVRFLKNAGYGRFALLNTQVALERGQVKEWLELTNPAWDADKFGAQCAGCHTTAVEAKTKTFAAFGLDCYTCHGNVPLEHTSNTELVWLAKKRRADNRAIISICAQCHLRSGHSRSTGLPYPNNFIAGDNLFQDFAVDFAQADDEQLNAGDRHIWRNVRDVVLYGRDEVTCLSCHQVHANSSQRHRRVLKAPICFECHQTEGPMKNLKPYTVHSALCEY